MRAQLDEKFIREEQEIDNAKLARLSSCRVGCSKAELIKKMHSSLKEDIQEILVERIREMRGHFALRQKKMTKEKEEDVTDKF